MLSPSFAVNRNLRRQRALGKKTMSADLVVNKNYFEESSNDSLSNSEFSPGLREVVDQDHKPRQSDPTTKDVASRKRTSTEYRVQKKDDPRIRDYPTKLNFDEIEAQSLLFANFIRENDEVIKDILTKYECYQVAEDEIERSLDVLENIRENVDYFHRKIGEVTSFLPRNQPIYALVCFGVVPSLMASAVHVRPPTAMKHFFLELTKALDLENFFPKLTISYEQRNEFLEQRSATRIDDASGKKIPVSDVVIFTGTMENADKLRKQFSTRTLFIANGAGHNPLVVTESASITEAVNGALRVQLYNQGQDCANPNAILVHESNYEEFVATMRHGIQSSIVGDYKNRNTEIGPISDPEDLVRIQELLVKNSQWIDPATPGIIHTATSTVEPTLILKPLSEGGNFDEQFAPILFVQKYSEDEELSDYFEDKRYANNAMYVTVFGRSSYVNRLTELKAMGKHIHDESTIIRNQDLHAPGVERGTQPYGGYGRGASCFSIYGKVSALPTLPQRDIYEQLVEPSIRLEEKLGSDSKNFEESNRSALPSIRRSVKSIRKEDKMNSNQVRKQPKAELLANRVPPTLLQSGDKHWGSTIATEVLKQFPDRDLYTCAAGISPSGPIHFGNFRDVMTAATVHHALLDAGKESRLIMSWDNYDRFRKVPDSIDAGFEKYIGLPLTSVPDPLGEYESYAARFENQFQKAVEELGIEMDYIYQTGEYQSGRYDDAIISALQNRAEIADVLLSYMSNKGKAAKGIDPVEYKEKFFPISIYSRFSGKDSTKILEYDGESSVTYKCFDSDEIETVDLREARIAKLAWKIDWPMRWKAEGVVFEPGGSDHASPGGSFDVASKISNKIYESVPPVFVGYSFIGLRGLDGKMSGSAGGAVTPSKLLEIYEPEVLRWLYQRKTPDQPFDLAFDTEVYRQYDEFDRAISSSIEGELQGAQQGAVAASLGKKDIQQLASPIPFKQAVALGQIAQWDEERVTELSELTGQNYSSDSISTRLAKARSWLQTYNEDKIIKLLSSRDTTYCENLSEEAKGHISALHAALLEEGQSIEELESVVYAIPKVAELTKKENSVRQRAFFKDVYNLLVGCDTGPRLSTFLWATERDRILKLLKT